MSEPNLVGTGFSKLIIISSLEPKDDYVGSALADFVRTLLSDLSLEIVVETHTCSYAAEFPVLLDAIAQEAQASGERIFLHVDMHGSKADGLVFANGSELAWSAVADRLLHLNKATKFNLFALFSACFGAYFTAQLNILGGSPCYALLAPSEQVDPGEIMGSCMRFYRQLFATLDLGTACTGISNEKLSTGLWFYMAAETWYEKMLVSFVATHCTEPEIERLTRSAYQAAKDVGARKGKDAMRRLVVERLSHFINGGAFDTFFMTEAIPSNVDRFSEVLIRTHSRLKKLRMSGHIKPKLA
jgi:hypothetical protein